MVRFVSLLVLLWSIVGVVAAGQHGYISHLTTDNCAGMATIAVTVIAGPLNYLGVYPKIENCRVPQPGT
jgi:hypothetical protein